MWINRDLLSFQWFLELLMNLDQEQSSWPATKGRFLDIALYQTGNKRCPDAIHPQRCTHCSATGQMLTESTLPMDSILKAGNETCRCISTLNKVQHLLSYGRPVWDEVINNFLFVTRFSFLLYGAGLQAGSF